MKAKHRGMKAGMVSRVAVAMVILLGCMTGSYAQVKSVNIHAHRGGAHEYDENTLYALSQTYEQGIRGFEIDIRLTKDGELVLFHDASLERMVGVEGPIEDLTLSEIKSLRTKVGNEIPTLDEVLHFFKDKEGVYLEFEMKTNNPMYDETELKEYCGQLVEKVYASKPATSSYLLTSFDKRPLAYLKENYPEAELMLIKSVALSEELLQEARELGLNRVACRIEGTSRAVVQQAKKEGFTVCLWPGTTIDDFLLGVALGGDRLCTDIPIAVSKWVDENAPWLELN